MEEIHDKKPRSTNKRRMRAKLIVNPGSGVTGESPVQLMDVISAMQAWKLVPEACLVEPGCDLPAVVQNALEDRIRVFVVCGGDGTIDVMAGTLAGTNATLGIIPTGTQNNVALSPGIPADIPAAIAITGGLIPLAPYLLISNAGSALMFSVVFAFVALLTFGYVKGRFTGAPPLRSALQTALISGLAAAVAFGLVRLISK